MAPSQTQLIRSDQEPILAPARRNGNRAGSWRAEAAPARPQGAKGGSRAGSVAAAWVNWLSPRFGDNGSAYFTGTYSDDYGYANGLMVPRNVHKDVKRFLDREVHESLRGRLYICGVEQHAYRDILHWHGIVQGDFTQADLDYLKETWAATRGHARVLPVTDGCASYVTKYALKGDTDNFEWRL